MHRPRIGIPLSLDDRGRWRSGRAYHYIDRSYADAVDRAGGAPIHLPIQSEVEDLIETIDALLLPGGDDLPPQSPLPPEALDLLDLVPATQLAFDRMLFEAARDRGLPILGICYGMQLMATATGGRLDAHLPTERPEAADHKLAPDGLHPIAIAPDSRLAEIAGGTTAQVNSLHHQGVRSPGRGQQIVARSPDGIIEAIEGRATDAAGPAPFLLGVQWHPEKQRDAFGERLFRAFVDAARKAGTR